MMPLALYFCFCFRFRNKEERKMKKKSGRQRKKGTERKDARKERGEKLLRRKKKSAAGPRTQPKNSFKFGIILKGGCHGSLLKPGESALFVNVIGQRKFLFPPSFLFLFPFFSFALFACSFSSTKNF